MELLSNIVIPFVATFAGVFLAYYLAARHERNRRKGEEAQARDEVKNTLFNELSAIKDSLDEAVYLRQEAKISDIPHLDLATDGLRSAVNSGKFSLLEPELQREVSHIYAVIERAQDYLTRMKDFVTSLALAVPFADKIFEGLSISFWGQVQHLREHIPGLQEKLRNGIKQASKGAPFGASPYRSTNITSTGESQ